MNMTTPLPLAGCLALCRRLVHIAILGLVAFSAPARAADGGGTISGNVTNVATRNRLQGAKVEIPQLGISALSDSSGQYVLSNVPAGPHEIVSSYLGLDTAKTTVLVRDGQRTSYDFDLTSGIYALESFKVSGEREGNAAMITEKRNANNVKDVVAMDSFGIMSNMSAGEVVRLMPGVAGSPTDEGLNYNFNIRGTAAGLNNVTVDGGQLTNYGSSRTFEMQSINTSLFEAVEIVKGQTPEKSADSLGAAVNFRTASTLKIREDQRTTYNASVRWAPPFLEQTPIRSQHRSHPLLNLTHQRVFDILGGKRNLGVALSLFYSENAVGGFEARFERTNALTGVAPMYNYQNWDNTNNRKQQNGNIRFDFEPSANSKFSFTITENENIEHMRRRNRITMAAGTGIANGNNSTTAPSATTGLQPDSTDLITRVRALNPSNTASLSNNIDVNMEGPIHYDIRNFSSDFTGEHKLNDLTVEYALRFSRSKLLSLAGNGAVLNMRLFDPSKQTIGSPVVFGGAGWIIDQSRDTEHPTVTQNGGPDFTNPYNYMPTTNGLSGARNQDMQSIRQFRLDLTYKVPVSIPMSIKSGYHYRMLEVAQEGKDRRRWSFNGTLRYDPNLRVVSEPSYVSLDRAKTGLAIPYFQTVGGNVSGGFPANPALWTEDRYFYESQKYVGERTFNEWIPAYYSQIEGKFGREGFLNRLGYLAGVRWENVRDKGIGYVQIRQSLRATTAEQVADPIAAAVKDYGTGLRVVRGNYWQNFPSVHTFYDITPNLKLRSSWSTSYGRPAVSNLLPGETVDETNLRVTTNNPALKPQRASNWDTTLEYYFEPVGSLTVSWFHKDIKDFINSNQIVGTIGAGNGNGFDGQYEGYELRTSLNGGTVTTQGWEFGYNQQFTFLPGLLKGLSANANYTWIDTHGYQTGTVYLSRREIANFIPRVYNLGLNWRYAQFGVHANYNYTSEYLTGSNNDAGLRQYRYSFKTLQGGVSYQYKPAVTFSVDVSNVIGHDQLWYKGSKDHGLNRITDNFITLTFGVSGRF